MASYDEAPEWAAFERIALMTVRLFYDLPEYFVMKALLTAPSQLKGNAAHPELQFDEQLKARLCLTLEYVRKVLARLKADGLVIAVPPKVKQAMGDDGRSSGAAPSSSMDANQCLWGVDFQRLVDAVAYKLDSMERQLSSQQAASLMIFRCPVCGMKESSLDIDYGALLSPSGGGLRCPSGQPGCFGAELVEEEASDAGPSMEVHRAALKVHVSVLHEALNDVVDLLPPTYKRPRDIDNSDTAALKSAAGSSRGPHGISNLSSSTAGANTLGASRGIAAALSSASQPLPPWMLSNAQAAAAAAAEEVQQRDALTETAKLSEQEQEDFMRKYEESQRAALRTSHESNRQQAADDANPVVTMLPAAHPGGPAPGLDDDDDEFEEVEVMVNGVSKAISEVTPEDIDNMTDEEHRMYFELSQLDK